jgi:hypothetical protein
VGGTERLGRAGGVLFGNFGDLDCGAAHLLQTGALVVYVLQDLIGKETNR